MHDARGIMLYINLRKGFKIKKKRALSIMRLVRMCVLTNGNVEYGVSESSDLKNLSLRH